MFEKAHEDRSLDESVQNIARKARQEYVLAQCTNGFGNPVPPQRNLWFSFYKSVFAKFRMSST